MKKRYLSSLLMFAIPTLTDLPNARNDCGRLGNKIVERMRRLH